MYFLRRLLLVAVLLLGAGALAGALPTDVRAEGTCMCGCTAPGGAMINGTSGPACGSDSACTLAACEGYCAGVGGVRAQNRRRQFSCVTTSPEAAARVPAPAGPATPATDAPAPAPAASDAAAPPAATPPSGTGASPAAAPSGGTGSLRFSLPTCTETGNCTLTDIINTGVRFANFLIAFSGVIFLITFLYAGAWLVFFAYDAGAIKKAQGMITGAAIGIVIVMTAGVAVRFVGTALGVNGTLTRLPGSSTRTTPAPTPAPASTTPAPAPRATP